MSVELLVRANTRKEAEKVARQLDKMGVYFTETGRPKLKKLS